MGFSLLCMYWNKDGLFRHTSHLRSYLVLPPPPHHPASLSWYWPFWTDVTSVVLYLLKGCSHFLYSTHIDTLQKVLRSCTTVTGTPYIIESTDPGTVVGKYCFLLYNIPEMMKICIQARRKAWGGTVYVTQAPFTYIQCTYLACKG